MKDKTSINRKSNTGAVERETKIHDKEGDIMAIATRDVISIPPSKSIKDTAKVMMEHEFRRLPITDPGSGKLLGIVTVMDILDFFGGGKKFDIIEKKYQDNFLAAINEPVKEIMTRDLITVSKKASIGETLEVMLGNQLGAIPIVDGDGLAGIVTERDIALSLAGVAGKDIVQDYMSPKVFTTTPGTSLGDACKIMVRNGLRRIPIVGGEADISKAAKKLLGILTSTDVIRYINAKELFDNLNSNLASDVLEKTKISDIMAKDPITVESTMTIGELCELFSEENIGGVPVVKGDDVMGIITERDVLNAVKRY